MEEIAIKSHRRDTQAREYKRRKHDCNVDLLFDWFGIRLIQTSQTGGQQYSDTSPFSIPCSNIRLDWKALPGTSTTLFEQV
jgi:hypothetical protein